MSVEIISWSISTKVWDRGGIKLGTPGSAVRLASVARYITDCATQHGNWEIRILILCYTLLTKGLPLLDMRFGYLLHKQPVTVQMRSHNCVEEKQLQIGWITYELKSYHGWEWNERRTIQSKERMEKSFKWANFPGNNLLKRIHSVVLPVMANIAQSLIGDWKHIVVADLEGFPPPPPPGYLIYYENEIIWS